MEQKRPSFRVPLKEFLFYVPYSIWLIWQTLSITLFSTYVPSSFSKYISLLTVGLLGMRWLCYTKFISRRLICFFVLIIVGLIIYLNSTRLLFFTTLFLVISAFDVSFVRLSKISILLLLSMIVLTVFSSMVGIIDNLIFYQDERRREALGFTYSGLVNVVFMNCIYIFFYMMKDKLKLYHWIIPLVGMYCLYLKTNTRTDLFLSTLLFFIWLLILRKKRFSINTKLFRCFGVMIYPGIALLSIILTLVFDFKKSYFRELNDIFSGRLGLAWKMYTNEGYNLLGDDIVMAGGTYAKQHNVEYNYVDNGYLQTAFLYGLVILFIIAGAYSFIAYRAAQNNDVYLFTWLLFNAIENFIYPNLIDPKFNLLCMALAMSHYNYSRNREVKFFHWKRIKMQIE